MLFDIVNKTKHFAWMSIHPATCDYCAWRGSVLPLAQDNVKLTLTSNLIRTTTMRHWTHAEIVEFQNNVGTFILFFGLSFFIVMAYTLD